MKYVLILSLLLLSGCVTTSEQKKRVNDPTQSMLIRHQLKSNEDIKYYNKLQENNRETWIDINEYHTK